MFHVHDFLTFQRFAHGEQRPSPRENRGEDPANELAPLSREAFDAFVKLRVDDNTRYEGGVALLRAGVRPVEHQQALQRALATELRRTDAYCHDHDGSFLVCLTKADAEIAELVSERLVIATQELGPPHVEPMFRIAVAAAGGHAMDDETLWEHVEEAWAERDWILGIQLVVRRHLDS